MRPVILSRPAKRRPDWISSAAAGPATRASAAAARTMDLMRFMGIVDFRDGGVCYHAISAANFPPFAALTPGPTWEDGRLIARAEHVRNRLGDWEICQRSRQRSRACLRATGPDARRWSSSPIPRQRHRMGSRRSGWHGGIGACATTPVATPGSSDKAISVDDLADDLTGLLDSLGVARAHIVGLSLGGMTGQALASRKRACGEPHHRHVGYLPPLDFGRRVPQRFAPGARPGSGRRPAALVHAGVSRQRARRRGTCARASC